MLLTTRPKGQLQSQNGDAGELIFCCPPFSSFHSSAETRTHKTESRPVKPTPDPLTFALIRLAILLYPLTSAAPSSLVDSLKLSGDLHARALGAGTLAALLLAGRLPAQ